MTQSQKQQQVNKYNHLKYRRTFYEHDINFSSNHIRDG